MKLDLVLRLREARRLSGLSQKEAAKASGVGEKSISSYETGERIEALKVRQLKALLRVYNITEERFYSESFEDALLTLGVGAPIGGLTAIADQLRSLPEPVSEQLIAAFKAMVSHAHVNTASRKGGSV